MLGRHLLTWIRNKNLQVEILGEFDDAALMKAFGLIIMLSLLHLLFIPMRHLSKVILRK